MGNLQRVYEDLLRTLATANIPIEKVPDIRPFLIKYCYQGVTCPTTAEGFESTPLLFIISIALLLKIKL